MNGKEAPGARLTYEFIDGPRAPLLGEFLAYWERKRGERIAPRRGDIDPAEIPAHLPFVHLVDVLDGGADYRFRVIGTALTSGIGRDSTGKLFSDLYDPDTFTSILKRYRVVVDEKRPAFTEGLIWWSPDRKRRPYASAALPLSEDGEAVTMIFTELILL